VAEPSVRDLVAVESFRNFLSWGVFPENYTGHRQPDRRFVIRRPVPPAWFAYAMGLTSYCPPKGEM
jgi:hypothetical protein